MKGKPAVLGLGCFLLLAAGLLLPCRVGSVGALVDNLWTAEGWGVGPTGARRDEILHWERRQWGARWAWLVQDREVGGDAWFVRVTEAYLLLYVGVAGACAAGVTVVAAEGERRRGGGAARED